MMSMRLSTRSAFTLVELLVVIAIIGTLVGLLLPAVQAARESARRSTCVNNLKQIGVALHNYADAKKALPPAAISDYMGTAQYNLKGWGWTFQILPYMEEAPLYDSLITGTTGWSHTVTFLGGVYADRARTRLSGYLCPSCPLQSSTVEGAYNGLATTPGYESGKSNYAGCGGFSTLGCSGTNPDALAPCIDASLGAVRKLRGRPFREITDGLSKTFLAGECGGLADPALPGPPANERMPGLWIGTYSPTSDSTSSVTVIRYSRYKPNSGAYDAFGSLHPGGTNFVMCDGSVRFVGDTIASGVGSYVSIAAAPAGVANATTVKNAAAAATNVYQQLSTVADGNAIKDF